MEPTTSDPPPLVLELDAFSRSVVVNQGTPHAFFFGAGTSITSGVPSAQRCIWEWKRSIFLSDNPGCESQFGELSLPSIRERIQKWLDTRGGYPPLDSQEEYSVFIEKCYPIPEHRRLFFQPYIQKARPHLGYKLLCLLAEQGIVHSVWTTNFDGLMARAAASYSLVPVEVGIDTKERLPRVASRGELLCVSLHGDYRYDRLKNTAEELKEQERSLQQALVQCANSAPLIVCGYSGRDVSVMSTFRTAYSTPGKSSLYWCGFGDQASTTVRELLELARSNGHNAFYVSSKGFDDLIYRIAALTLAGEKAQSVRNLVTEFGSTQQGARAPFEVGAKEFHVAIKGNAFPITTPTEGLVFDLVEWPLEKRWKWLEELTDATGVVAVPYKTKVLCLGTIDEVKSIFREKIQGPIERSPLDEKEKRYDDTATKSLLLRALVRSVCKTTGLPTDNREFIWNQVQPERFFHEEQTYLVYDAAFLSLRRIGDSDFLVIMPSLHVTTLAGEAPAPSVTKFIRQTKLGWQHNKPFNEAMVAWSERIWKQTQGRFECPPGCGSTFHFQMKKNPAFGKVSRPGFRPLIIKPSQQSHYRYAGIQLEEPKLVFAAKDGDGSVLETHPIRGILENRPYDHLLTRRGFLPSVRISVVCPQESSPRFESFLGKANVALQPSPSEADYLTDFPGFVPAFKLPMELARRGEAGWQFYAPPREKKNPKNAALEMARNILQAIDAARAASLPHVIIVCIPSSVESWTRYETEDELFDLHDFVKAYCVQNGIATQFIEESTCDDSQQCRVWWWLSLALYVKAMRVPWLLDGLDKQAAFVGFGISIDRKAETGRQVVLGCSHIYSSQGLGLQYRLTRVEDPIFIGRKNAFLSRDDARRVGEMVRQLFWDAQLALPQRVVFHKRTNFHKQEREGLLDALGDVAVVDMIELNVADDLRYVSSWMGRDGLQIGNYPVQRGTVLKLEDFLALVWVHGATSAVHPTKTYYQGKRRIPAPLMLKRHSGSTPMRQLAYEVLGLSKMHWNTFDLYTRLPSTIESSNEIARIGALLQGVGSRSYDYRLFI